MFDLNAVLRRIVFFALGVMTFYVGWTSYENHVLTNTNATLAELVYTKIDSIADARVVAIHREFDEALRAALTGGGAVGADRFLQRADTLRRADK